MQYSDWLSSRKARLMKKCADPLVIEPVQELTYLRHTKQWERLAEAYTALEFPLQRVGSRIHRLKVAVVKTVKDWVLASNIRAKRNLLHDPVPREYPNIGEVPLANGKVYDLVRCADYLGVDLTNFYRRRSVIALQEIEPYSGSQAGISVAAEMFYCASVEQWLWFLINYSRPPQNQAVQMLLDYPVWPVPIADYPYLLREQQLTECELFSELEIWGISRERAESWITTNPKFDAFFYAFGPALISDYLWYTEIRKELQSVRALPISLNSGIDYRVIQRI